MPGPSDLADRRAKQAALDYLAELERIYDSTRADGPDERRRRRAPLIGTRRALLHRQIHTVLPCRAPKRSGARRRGAGRPAGRRRTPSRSAGGGSSGDSDGSDEPGGAGHSQDARAAVAV